MSFGEFCQRVLSTIQLTSKGRCHLEGVNPFIIHHGIKEKAFDKLYDGYTAENRESYPDWLGRVSSTALEIRSEMTLINF